VRPRQHDQAGYSHRDRARELKPVSIDPNDPEFTPNPSGKLEPTPLGLVVEEAHSVYKPWRKNKNPGDLFDDLFHYREPWNRNPFLWPLVLALYLSVIFLRSLRSSMRTAFTKDRLQ
jgi:hypothetical protein